MTDATFEKVQHSDTSMYGPSRLLLCGFPAPSQGKFKIVLEMAGLGHVPVVWASEADRQAPLKELLALPDDSGRDVDSTLPRAVIVSGITENQLHELMDTCRKTGMQQALWAALTPTSETWPLGRLLGELQSERRALSRRKTQPPV
ncbi:hypothetical protein DSCO28_09440 [Desulfosarcina ovata subsp. sediminis]|uniref:DUF3783 domain-containing protein n=1 Tax=Desulfosarcina ovata subsp. sediminis TaxID=885957 RepID=A0A5K7ZDW7_9BACT|nr:DUF3783 domain-containing protein [Desulfosarcina ovata]BBO80378.1 hypothetical protein DSCO28_09440 [Desulfosarcina ovata subsp. sediminis]